MQKKFGAFWFRSFYKGSFKGWGCSQGLGFRQVWFSRAVKRFVRVLESFRSFGYGLALGCRVLGCIVLGFDEDYDYTGLLHDCYIIVFNGV